MADQPDEDMPTLKRKGSASPEAESGTAKRFKVEEERSGETSYDDADGTIDETSNDLAMKEGSAAPQEEMVAEERPSTSPRRRKDEKEEGEQEEDDEMRDRSPRRSPRRSSISDHPKHESPAPATSRRNFSLEEKKRGQRLFGGLLSTLNKSAPNTHQKKRQEIEKRQQERAQQQWVEDDKRRTEKLAKLTPVRKIEQVKFDEQVMRTRHASMLAAANSLRTRSEPRIYYRPWLLTESQERIIKEQIQDAEETIEREVRDFERRKEQRLKDLGVLDSPPESDAVGEPAPSKSTNHPHSDSKASHDRDHDETGDEMEQDKEDAVLY